MTIASYACNAILVGWVKALRNPPLVQNGGFRKAFTHYKINE